MRFLFVVQGEGREHCSQALALEEILLRNGHEVVEMLVGRSSYKPLPGFFNRDVQSPVKWFLSPNLLPSTGTRWMELAKKIFLSIVDIPEYMRSMRYINRRIRETGAEVVLNFYEPLTGLLYGLFPHSTVPCVCIGHPYLYLIDDLNLDNAQSIQYSFFRFLTNITCWGATKCLALSVMPFDSGLENISVVPPVIRQEISSIHPEKGDYIHGFLGRPDQVRPIMEFHYRNKEVPIHLFRRNSAAPELREIDDTFFLHQFEETRFLNYLSDCRISINTASFETICESLYLDKPLIMMPGNISQYSNALCASRIGAGIIVDKHHSFIASDFEVKFELGLYKNWVGNAEKLILSELEKISYGQHLPSPILSSIHQ